tara:strand:+ start:1188 stop:2390 length:1203 start_codon:yes stop_codon:yes gene_type:complete
MESNQELFRQAILDAKAVRETSLASARATLAEHFEPLVKSMFQETVENIEEGDDDKMEEAKMHDMKKAKKHDMEEAKMHDMEESTLDEILAELDALSEDDMNDSGLEEQTTTTAGYDEKAHTAKGETGYDEKAKTSHGDHKLHEAEDDDDTEEDDKDAEADDKAEEAGEDLTKDMEAGEGTDEQEVVDITVGELKDIIRDVFMTLQGGDMAADTAALDADTDLAMDLGTDDAAEMDTDDEISLDEILAQLEAEEKVEEGAAAGEIPGGQITSKAADTHKVEEMKKELNEAVKTIKALKTELNEINLFNAKLMYVNKIFKAKNLSESQKTKVINAFDRATSVKEVENTYKTLLESVSADTKKSSLKESVGFASKPIGSAPARPIVETDALYSRWQTLAGIK